jgi:hypothetical protein
MEKHLLRPFQHLRAIVAPVADGGVGGCHLHLAGVVRVEKVQGRAWVAALVIDAQPAVLVPGVQDESETVVDRGHEFIGFRCNDRKGPKAGTLGPFPRVPDTGESKWPGFDGGDGEDPLDGLRCLRFPGRLRGRAKEISWARLLYRRFGGGFIGG